MTSRRIAVLPEALANKIAAGEVIQRPASVVKELLENSQDAGARHVQVIIKEGGKKLIQVVDDGSGMDEQDAVSSFLRHATSKISSYEDLECIRTYGFRGEALASIAAVARVTMKTRRSEDDAAVVVRIDGGGAPEVSREGRVPGTSITVQQLFYNVPARLKFLKSGNTEFRHLYDVVHRVAISQPDLALTFVSDDETIFDLAPSSLPERLRDVFGDRQFDALIPVAESGDFLNVRGYIGKPAVGQKSRSNQYLFLNGRSIVNRNINHAVFSAYENYLIQGSFPFFLLFLEVDPHKVDVNVHPSKMEAKFEGEQAVYHFVSALVRKSLGSAEFVPALSMRSPGESGMTGLQFTPRQHSWAPAGGGMVDTSTGEIVGSRGIAGSGIAADLLRPTADRQDAVKPEHAGTRESNTIVEGSAPRLVWQLHKKYILTPIDGGLMIIDQHVAHERVIYERALDRMEKNLRSSQQLLFPFTLQLSPGDTALVEELLPYFDELGFAIKLFGKNTIVVEGLPPDTEGKDGGKIVADMLALYREYQQHSPMEVRDNLAKSFSCRSAVKAGDPLTDDEMRSLLAQLFAARMPYVCPHGRPIVLRIPTEELDRRFGRK